jgi:hypothetical protein
MVSSSFQISFNSPSFKVPTLPAGRLPERPSKGRETVKQNAKVHRDFIEHALEEDAVALVDGAQARPHRRRIDLEASGLETASDALLDDPPLLAHAKRSEPVQHGEGLLPNHPVNGFSGSLLVGRPTSGQMIDSFPQERCDRVLLIVQVGHGAKVRDLPRGLDAVDGLKLRSKLI